MTNLIDRLRDAPEMTDALFWEAAHELGFDKHSPEMKDLVNLVFAGAWLDAALLLVPEGWAWRVSFITNDQHAASTVGPGFCATLQHNDSERVAWVKHRHEPAIALLIAILQAHEATKPPSFEEVHGILATKGET